MKKAMVPRFNAENGFVTTEERSALMAKIKSKDTKPEVVFRKALWQLGIRYRKNYKKLPGSPDIYLPKYKLSIFIDGEFWHGYDWENKKGKIKSNDKFWIAKIERNMERDKKNNKLLNEMGINVIRFWGNMVLSNLEMCIESVLSKIIRVNVT
jgi:DNA mismatch endonuclease (patch repair protein)